MISFNGRETPFECPFCGNDSGYVEKAKMDGKKLEAVFGYGCGLKIELPSGTYLSKCPEQPADAKPFKL